MTIPSIGGWFESKGHAYPWGMKASLIAAAGLLALLGSTACGGGEADIPALATQAADATASPALEIRARGTKFDKNTLVVPAGRQVTLAFDNQDNGTNHNVAVYTGADARENLFRGDLFEVRRRR